MKRAFHDLEKARQDTPGDYTDIASDVADEDDAEQTKSSIIDRLYALVESLLTAKSTLEKAKNKLTTVNQALSNFMTWLEDIERKLRSVVPDEVTLKAFEDVTACCNVSIYQHWYITAVCCTMCRPSIKMSIITSHNMLMLLA